MNSTPAEEKTQTDVAGARKVSRRWPLISALVAVALAAALGVVISVRAGNLPLGFDEEWASEVLENRGIWFDAPALFMNWLGGGLVGVLVVPLGTVAVLCLLRRFWAALFFAIAAAASAGLVQLLKGLLHRPRPEDIMVIADAGSFPSGHVANAATLAVTLAIIVGRVWVWAAGAAYTVLMMLSRTYLGAHWLSDTIGGLLIGVGVAVIVWAPLAHRLAKERLKTAP
ncbi:undecaprenyl-diphosphatase [Homoserinimonas aerilata]|uniref:Undecaprenyl-diphosphatase n=1 Tax=Homoserinimonas aerilata TaxID=1162970 RepID=A0A542YL19_9MICO|nr:phosphatase PAP2 family protein [Homoserinimonas aerilata]TQL48790.1 undecaprenyl-diphosphatase [Homoserinimonas aerilata]